jgi:hypothetical protein
MKQPVAPISRTSVLVAFVALAVGLVAIAVCVISLIRLRQTDAARPAPPVPAQAR